MASSEEFVGSISDTSMVLTTLVHLVVVGGSSTLLNGYLKVLIEWLLHLLGLSG